MGQVAPGYRVFSGRVCKRYTYVVFLCFGLCFLVLRYTGGPKAVGTHHVTNAVNSRLLLQNINPLAVTSPTKPFDLSQWLNQEPSVDNSYKYKSDLEYVKEIQSTYPNFPVVYWKNVKGNMQKNKTCAKFPNIYDLNFNNLYWQMLLSTNGTFYLYGAYYDNRTTVQLRPVVRILGMIDRIQPTVKTYCQMWFMNKTTPLIVPVMEYKYIWVHKWGNYKQGVLSPYLIGCRVPSNIKEIPEVVSLVEKQCDTATNSLRVIYDKPKEKKDFAVCVKGLDFPRQDFSVRLVEWIELLQILGAHKIFMYQLEVHPNISKILNYYVKSGFVDLTPITLPGKQPNLPGFMHLYLKAKVNNKRQNELIPYNDCMYKNMYKYKYVVLLDTDEVIMPMRKASWSEMMADVEAEAKVVKPVPIASYNVRNVYFLDDLQHEHGWYDDIPKYMHMLQHVFRSRNFTKPGQYIKSFHSTERVLTLHNHYPLACLEGSCKSYAISTNDAQLQHYRKDCVKTLKKSCATDYRDHSVEDKTIWKYKEELIARTTEVLQQLGFFDNIASTDSSEQFVSRKR